MFSNSENIHKVANEENIKDVLSLVSCSNNVIMQVCFKEAQLYSLVIYFTASWQISCFIGFSSKNSSKNIN